MSKQLDSILGRATRATPPAEASVPEENARALQARVASTVKPAPAAPSQARMAAKSAARDAAKPKGRKPAPAPVDPAPKAENAAAEPQRPIQAVVPVSVARALAVKAAMEDTTVRDLILRGLAAIGLDVPEDECRDRRR